MSLLFCTRCNVSALDAPPRFEKNRALDPDRAGGPRPGCPRDNSALPDSVLVYLSPRLGRLELAEAPGRCRPRTLRTRLESK